MRKDIKELWVPDGLLNHPGRPLVSVSYVTIHTTGNHSPTATAEAHARFQFSGGGGRHASWHYTVDRDEIWQSFRDDQMCWHTGTLRGNERSIGIEICVNDSLGFSSACGLAAWLTAKLLKQYGLGMDRVRQHYDWSRKNCPMELRSGSWCYDWKDFMGMVAAYKAMDKDVSEWAKQAWDWGIVNHITDGSSPQGMPSREQVLQLLFNYDKHVKAN